jgi:hypothetical protein
MPHLLHVSSLLLGAALVCTVGCSRAPAPASEGGVGSRYSSEPLGFAVEFPFPSRSSTAPGYTLSAGGPESDPAMREDAFERFVASFRLL